MSICSLGTPSTHFSFSKKNVPSVSFMVWVFVCVCVCVWLMLNFPTLRKAGESFGLNGFFLSLQGQANKEVQKENLQQNSEIPHDKTVL